MFFSIIINSMPICDSSKLGSTQCGKSIFYWGKRTYIMGVINLSPDSFSGDGLGDTEAAVARAKRLAVEGADIIDVGGESTRPGSTPLSSAEELHRVIPTLERFPLQFSQIGHELPNLDQNQQAYLLLLVRSFQYLAGF